MMELLKRLEEQSRDDDLNPFETDEDEDDEHASDDLAHRLGGLDIGASCSCY
jgi:hypothetical protein